MPLLKDYENDTSLNILQVNWINPNLSTGFLYHTTWTGALSINSSIVTGVYSGDGLIYTGWATGNVYLYIDTNSLANTFVPYTGATNSVNIGTNSYISTSSSSWTSEDYPSSPTFTVSYTPVTAGSVYCNADDWMTGTYDLYDYYADGNLYDTMYNIQWTIDYSSGYVDTTGYNGWYIWFISYSFEVTLYTTSISYGGSTFTNGISATKDGNSSAGYFFDGANTLALCDWTNSVTSGSDIEITDYTKWVILKSPDWTRWRLTVDNTGTLIKTSL